MHAYKHLIADLHTNLNLRFITMLSKFIKSNNIVVIAVELFSCDLKLKGITLILKISTKENISFYIYFDTCIFN